MNQKLAKHLKKVKSMPWTWTRAGNLRIPKLPKGVTADDFRNIPTGHPDYSWFDGKVWWDRNGCASDMELI